MPVSSLYGNSEVVKIYVEDNTWHACHIKEACLQYEFKIKKKKTKTDVMDWMFIPPLSNSDVKVLIQKLGPLGGD